MKVKDYKDGKIVILSTAFDTRPKILNLIYFINFFAGGTLFLRMIFINADNPGLVIFGCIVTIALYIAAYRFVKKAVAGEEIFINKECMHLIRQGGLFKARKQRFDIKKISGFRHLAKPKLTKHPLAGGSFDYLGFDTEQQVINDMHGDNRLAFDYEGKTITFGHNIYSWDFEVLEVMLYDITGNDFRYDDEFEETNFS